MRIYLKNVPIIVNEYILAYIKNNTTICSTFHPGTNGYLPPVYIKDFYVKDISSHQRLLHKWASAESINDFWSWVILAEDLKPTLNHLKAMMHMSFFEYIKLDDK